MSVMMRLRNHGVVLTKSHHEQIGYDEAEDLIRGLARRGDPIAAQAIAEIDAADAERAQSMAALNADMSGRLGMTMDEVCGLVRTLVDDPALEKWLLRRVNLTRSEGRDLGHHEHHVNG